MSQLKDYAPVIAMENSIHLQHALRFKDPQNPDVQEMPQGQHVVLKRFSNKAEASKDPNDFGSAEVIGKLCLQVNFTEAEVGKTVYYRCCYICNQGDKGPWSEILTVGIV